MLPNNTCLDTHFYCFVADCERMFKLYEQSSIWARNAVTCLLLVAGGGALCFCPSCNSASLHRHGRAVQRRQLIAVESAGM